MVLPVPVRAVPTMSLPSKAGGMASAWMGVGLANPRRLTAECRRLSSLNELNGIFSPVDERLRKDVPSDGIEPPTLALGKLCSIQLSYEGLNRKASPEAPWRA